MQDACPSWMSHWIYGLCPNESRINGTISCKGCDRVFRAQVTFSKASGDKTRTQGEVAFHVHCIEECDEYKNLGLISHCQPCQLTFMTPRGLKLHQRSLDCLGSDKSSSSKSEDEELLQSPSPLIQMIPFSPNANIENTSRDQENEMSIEVKESDEQLAGEELIEPSIDIQDNCLSLAPRSLSLVALCYDSDVSEDEVEEKVATPMDLSVRKELPLVDDGENQIAVDSPLDLTLNKNSPNLVVNHPHDQTAVDDDDNILIVYEDIRNPLQVADAVELDY